MNAPLQEKHTPGKYRAVFFDAGNTLFRVHPSVGEVYLKTARSYGFQVPEVTAEEIEQRFQSEFHRRSALHRLDQAGVLREVRAWWYDLVMAIFAPLGGVPRFDEFFDDLYALFATEAVWRLFPETLEVLQACRDRGMVMGIVSNWDLRLPQIVEALGLAEWFDFILASSMIGKTKPDPAIFQEALKQAGVGAREAIHLGDSMEDDIRGAQAVGIDALLIQRMPNAHAAGVDAADSLRAVLARL